MDGLWKYRENLFGVYPEHSSVMIAFTSKEVFQICSDPATIVKTTQQGYGPVWRGALQVRPTPFCFSKCLPGVKQHLPLNNTAPHF